MLLVYDGTKIIFIWPTSVCVLVILLVCQLDVHLGSDDGTEEFGPINHVYLLSLMMIWLYGCGWSLAFSQFYSLLVIFWLEHEYDMFYLKIRLALTEDKSYKYNENESFT